MLACMVVAMEKAPRIFVTHCERLGYGISIREEVSLQP